MEQAYFTRKRSYDREVRATNKEGASNVDV